MLFTYLKDIYTKKSMLKKYFKIGNALFILHFLISYTMLSSYVKHTYAIKYSVFYLIFSDTSIYLN